MEDLKLCVNCVHHEYDSLSRDHFCTKHICQINSTCLVTGEEITTTIGKMLRCKDERTITGLCGIAGIYFKELPKEE